MDLALSHIFKRKETSDHSPDVKIDRDHLPQHIGVIMDGNGRWAKKKGCLVQQAMQQERKPFGPLRPTVRIWAFAILPSMRFLQKTGSARRKKSMA